MNNSEQNKRAPFVARYLTDDTIDYARGSSEHKRSGIAVVVDTNRDGQLTFCDIVGTRQRRALVAFGFRFGRAVVGLSLPHDPEVEPFKGLIAYYDRDAVNVPFSHLTVSDEEPGVLSGKLRGQKPKNSFQLPIDEDQAGYVAMQLAQLVNNGVKNAIQNR